MILPETSNTGRVSQWEMSWNSLLSVHLLRIHLKACAQSINSLQHVKNEITILTMSSFGVFRLGQQFLRFVFRFQKCFDYPIWSFIFSAGLNMLRSNIYLPLWNRRGYCTIFMRVANLRTGTHQLISLWQSDICLAKGTVLCVICVKTCIYSCELIKS